MECFQLYVAVYQKCWDIGPRLLLTTNRKWHTSFHMKWQSSTLDDLAGHWQPVRSAILATAKLLVVFGRTFLAIFCFFFRRKWTFRFLATREAWKWRQALQLLLLRLLACSDALTTCYYPVMYCYCSGNPRNARHPGLTDVLPGVNAHSSVQFYFCCGFLPHISKAGLMQGQK